MKLLSRKAFLKNLGLTGVADSPASEGIDEKVDREDKTLPNARSLDAFFYDDASSSSPIVAIEKDSDYNELESDKKS